MLSRSKSAQGLRVLGSRVGSTGHQDTEMEYTFIKGLVEAYSQQCMPASYNKIPLRADKWTPVRETGPRYRLDLSSLCFPPRWATSSFSRLQDASTKDRRDGYRRYSASEIGESKPRMCRYTRTAIPVRNTFQRTGTTAEEKVLPVWTPELKEGIVFSHRYPSSSALSSTNTPTPGNEHGNILLKRTPGDNRCSSRSASPSRIPSPRPKIYRPLTTKRNQIRPKTVGATHRPPLKPNVRAVDDTDIVMPSSNEKPTGTNEKTIEGLTKMTQDQHTQTLSLDVFLPREVADSSVLYPIFQAHPSTGTKEESGKDKAEAAGELFSSRNQLLSNESKKPKDSNDVNEEDNDNIAGSHDDNRPSSNVCCPRYQNTIGKLYGTPAKGNCKKWIHCELFGPVLCSDCRLEREKNYHTLKLENDFSMPALSLRGRKPVLSPRN